MSIPFCFYGNFVILYYKTKYKIKKSLKCLMHNFVLNKKKKVPRYSCQKKLTHACDI